MKRMILITLALLLLPSIGAVASELPTTENIDNPGSSECGVTLAYPEVWPDGRFKKCRMVFISAGAGIITLRESDDPLLFDEDTCNSFEDDHTNPGVYPCSSTEFGQMVLNCDRYHSIFSHRPNIPEFPSPDPEPLTTEEFYKNFTVFFPVNSLMQ